VYDRIATVGAPDIVACRGEWPFDGDPAPSVGPWPHRLAGVAGRAGWAPARSRGARM